MTAPVALVTNGTFGLGAEIARSLADTGVRVAVADSGRHRSNHQAGADEVTWVPVSVHHGRVTSPADCDRVVKEVIQQHGQLDVLVWSDVLRMTASLPIERLSATEFDDVVASHLAGPVYLIQAALPAMLTQGSGRIINVLSGSGVLSPAGQAHLSAATSGLVTFTRRLAREVADRQVTANTVMVGMVNAKGDWTPDEVVNEAISLVPSGRLGDPSEVGRTVAFLAAPAAGYITGQCLAVDGGMGL